MIEIKDLLLKFNNLLVSEEVKKNSILNILKEVVGIQIKPEDIKIKNNTIYLNIKPIYKNEILYLFNLNKQPGVAFPIDTKKDTDKHLNCCSNFKIDCCT